MRLRVATGALAALYMLLVWLSYRYLIAPPFAYLGYKAEPIDLDIGLYCAGLGLLPMTWMPLSLDRPTKFVYWLVYLYVVNPGAVVAPMVLGVRGGSWLVSYALIILGFWLVSLGYLIDLRAVPRLRLRVPPRVFWGGFLALSLLNYLAVFLQFGLRIRFDLVTNLLSPEISATRLEARQAFESGGFALSGYSLTWQSGAMNPLLIAYGTVHRHRVALLAGLGGQLVLFSVAASKSMLISTLIVWLAIFLLHEDRRSRGGLQLVAVMLAVVLVAGAHQMATGSVNINSLLVRRAIVTPPVLTRYYFDFFSTHPKTYLSQSILGGYLHYPYVSSIPRTVGATYIGDATSANANFFADAFANFGLVGVIAFSLVLAAIFAFIDANSQRLDLRLGTAVLAVAGMSLVNSALFTSLLTHGILLATGLLLALDGQPVGVAEVRPELVPPDPSPPRPARLPSMKAAAHRRADGSQLSSPEAA